MFEFLDRVESEAFANVRSLINDWLQGVPLEPRNELESSMRSSDDIEFLAGFWELYLHEAYTRCGFDLEVHPEVPGSTRRPDFRISSRSSEWIVEAKVVSGPAGERSAARRSNALLDQVNRVRNAQFDLWLELETQGSAQPAGASLASDLEAWLGELDRRTLRAAMEQGGVLSLPEFIWEDRGWQIRVLPIPRPGERVSESDFPLVAWGPGEAVMLDRSSLLQTALRSKRPSLYGELASPYVVAVNVEHWAGMTDDGVMEAMFGREAFEMRLDSAGVVDAQAVRIPNGFWWGPDGPRNTRVAAVLVIGGLRPWSVPRARPKIWLNPYAVNPLDITVPWATAVPDLEESRYNHRESVLPMAAHFGLPAEWPGEIDVL